MKQILNHVSIFSMPRDIFQIYTGVVQQFSTRILIEHPFLTTLMDRNKENTARDS
jgi:hypothetical protein